MILNANRPYVFKSSLIKEFPDTEPGVYTLSDGRQIGKTTLLKQWMLYLMEDKHVAAENISFIIFCKQEKIDKIHEIPAVFLPYALGMFRY